MDSPYMIPEWLERFGWVLIHFLWQGVLIGAIAWLILTMLRKSSANLRYGVLCGALACCTVAPCLTWVSLKKGAQLPITLRTEQKPELVTQPKATVTAPLIIATTISVQEIATSPKWTLERLLGSIHRGIPLCVAFWTIGVILLSLRLLYGWRELRKLCASGVPLKDQNWVVRFDQLADRMGIRHTILLLESVLVEVPTVIGWLRPMVLLPATFFTGLSPDQIEAILAHELAHIRRHDYLVNLVQIGIETLLFYHPIVWWLSRSIREERENCCDDLALQVVGDKLVYASALASLEESRSLPMAITLAATGGSLLQRIKRLLGASEGKPFPWPLFLLLAVVLAAGAFTLSSSSKIKSSASTKEDEATNKPELKSLVIKVQDEQGLPIEGAMIQPFDLRVKEDPGSDYRWNGENSKLPPFPIKTDTKGEALLRYPALIAEHLTVDTLGIEINHPNYCSEHTDIKIDLPTRVTLHRGMQLVISEKAPHGIYLSGPYADSKFENYKFSDAQWKHSSDGTLSVHIPQSNLLVRAVAFGANDSVYFSPPELIVPTASGTKSMQLDVMPGTTMEGVLDASVPRPIKNGTIIAMVATPVGNTDMKCEWAMSAVIGDDGKFTLPFLPSGDLQIIALCDGYVSKNPKIGIDNFRKPQIFPVDSSHLITVEMEAMGSVRVLVKDPSAQPLAKADVCFWPNQAFSVGTSILGQQFSSAEYLKKRQDHPDEKWVLDQSKTPLFSAKTSASGEVIIKNLPSGEQRLTVISTKFDQPILANAYSPRRQSVALVKPGKESTVTVMMEQKGTTSLEEAMKKARQQQAKNSYCGGPESQDGRSGTPLDVKAGKIFSGRVVDEQGNPIEGVDVHPWTWCPENKNLTDKNGNFKRYDLDPERSIEVRFSKAGLSPLHITRQPVGELLKPVVLNSKTYIEGVIHDPTGKPVNGVTITAKTGEKQADGCSLDNLSYDAVSDKDGHYRLFVHPDTYTIKARSAENLVAQETGLLVAQNEAKHTDLSLAGGLTFKARLTDSITGKPIKGVHISTPFSKDVDTISNEEGWISAPGLTEGDLKVEIEAEKLGYRRWWSPQAKNPWDQLELRAGKLQRNFDNLTFALAARGKPQEITMEKGVTIHGKIVDPEGHPVEGATAAPADTGTGNSLTGDTRFSVLSDKNGSFEMLLPASGATSYNLVTHDGDYDHWRKWANGTLLPIQTKPGEVINDVILRLSVPCRVRGVVTDQAGKPVANREVRSEPVGKDENRYYDPTVRTKQDGSFELNYVRPGKNLIQAAPFWLNAEKAPKDSTKIIEAKTDSLVEEIQLKVDLTNVPSAQSNTPIKQIKFSSKFLHISPPLGRLADPALAFLRSLTNTNNPPLILSASEMEAAMKALNHRRGVDLCSAPAGTTRVGHNGWVKIVQQCSYPTDWDRVEKGWKGKNFKKAEVGISIELLGTILPDGSCEMHLKPKEVEYRGYIDLDDPHGIQINDHLSPISLDYPNTKIIDIQPNGHRLKPEFTEYVRSVQVTTKPGQTVAFLTPGVQPRRPDSDKPNDEKYLIVFVTAEEVKMDSPPEPVPFSTVTSTNR